MIVGKTLDLDSLTMGHLVSIPVQRVHAAIGLLTAGIIHLAGGLYRAIVDFLQAFHGQHQVFGRIPGVHQHGLKRQLLLVYPLISISRT